MRPGWLVFMLLIAGRAQAAMCGGTDTLRLSLAQAEELMQQRALVLLAQHHAVEAASAARSQARLPANPELRTEWSVRPEDGRLFDVGGPNGQMAVHVEQLLRVAGQRGLAGRAADQRVRAAEAEYAELAATLRCRLRTALYRQYHLRQAVEAIGTQLDLLKELVDAYGVQLERGNVSLREVARLRSAYFELNDRRARLRTELNALQRDLQVLLVEERHVVAEPAGDEQELVPLLPGDTARLVDMALTHRPLLQAAEAAVRAGEWEEKYQRRSALPDLAVGATYDRNSNYLPNYTGLNVGLSVPLFDRRQAAVGRAHAEVEAARARHDQLRHEVRQEVLRALADLHTLRQHYLTSAQGLEVQLEMVSESLMDNYVKSNISLLEFTDLFGSCIDGIIAIHTLKADLHHAQEELELAVGRPLFGP